MAEGRPSKLLRIIAYARSGALDHAWRLFSAAGFDRIDDDPAVLSLRGRLLKDRALLATGAARQAAAREAAAAYAAAARLAPAAYPLINAATLALIGGDGERSVTLAGEVLAHLAASPDDEDTPYYRAATEAEARLLNGDVGAARAALDRAIALAPRAWEDHASTLRQFAVILAELGLAADWLEPLRPPRSLHFAGHMTLDGDEAALVARIDALLAAEKVGHGFGALAPGADLLIAERLLAREAELHVVLPGGRAAFEARTVRPYGADWAARYERALAAAATVTEVGDAAAFGRSIDLADQIAMGRTAMNARILATTAVQLLLGPGDGPAGVKSAKSAQLWARSGRRQHLLPMPATGAGSTADEPQSATASVLALSLTAADATALSDYVDGFADRLPSLAGVARTAGLLCPPRWSGDRLLAAYATPGDAFAAAVSLSAAGGTLRRALHIGIVARHVDPIDGGILLLGDTLAIAEAILGVAPDSAIIASEDFTAALSAGARDELRAEFIGELTSIQRVLPLYSLRRLAPVTR